MICECAPNFIWLSVPNRKAAGLRKCFLGHNGLLLHFLLAVLCSLEVHGRVPARQFFTSRLCSNIKHQHSTCLFHLISPHFQQSVHDIAWHRGKGTSAKATVMAGTSSIPFTEMSRSKLRPGAEWTHVTLSFLLSSPCDKTYDNCTPLSLQIAQVCLAAPLLAKFLGRAFLETLEPNRYATQPLCPKKNY